MWLFLVQVAAALILGLLLFRLIAAGESPPATISIQEATRIVLERFPNARIKEIELDTEDGRLVYEVELVSTEGREIELYVNAMTGKIEQIEHD